MLHSLVVREECFYHKEPSSNLQYLFKNFVMLNYTSSYYEIVGSIPRTLGNELIKILDRSFHHQDHDLNLKLCNVLFEFD